MFDPNIPADHADLTGAMFRGQFTGLKDLIDGVSGVTSAVVDAVNTLPAGDPATVSVSVTGAVLHLSFGIPEGPSGPPGEVTQEDLDNASIGILSQTSNNSNGVAMMGESADASYNQPQIQNLLNKMDELINALRR